MQSTSDLTGVYCQQELTNLSAASENVGRYSMKEICSHISSSYTNKNIADEGH